MLAPDAERVVLFHVVASGRCWIETDGGERLWAQAGDVIVLPYNDEHRMGGSAEADGGLGGRPDRRRRPGTSMPFIQHGEGGAPTERGLRLPGVRRRAVRPADADLPAGVRGEPARGRRAGLGHGEHRVRRRSRPRWSPRTGSRQPTQCPELLLVEVLKLHLATAPAADDGWLAAINDSVLAPALAAIHGSPEQKWTVDGAGQARGRVGRRCSTSGSGGCWAWRRSGTSPGGGCTSPRTCCASTDLGVAAVARRVGYDSEEAFSRAFKRAHDAAPSVWRVRRTI